MHFNDEIEKQEEYSAKKIIEQYFDFGNFDVNCEKPDLQNYINNIGIEVTMAIDSKTEAMKSRFGQLSIKSRNKDGSVKEYFNDTQIEERIKKIKNDYQNNNKVFLKIKKDNFGYYLQGKFYDASCYRKIFEPLIIESFKIKTEKLQNYKQFNKNGLFIFTEMLLDNSYIKYFYDIFNNLNQQYIENSKIIYDFVILKSVSSGFVLYIDMTNINNSLYFNNINNY